MDEQKPIQYQNQVQQTQHSDTALAPKKKAKKSLTLDEQIEAKNEELKKLKAKQKQRDERKVLAYLRKNKTKEGKTLFSYYVDKATKA